MAREGCAGILLTSAGGLPDERSVWPEFRRQAIVRGGPAVRETGAVARMAGSYRAGFDGARVSGD